MDLKRLPSSQRQHKLNLKSLIHTQNEEKQFYQLHSDSGTNATYKYGVSLGFDDQQFWCCTVVTVENKYFNEFCGMLQTCHCGKNKLLKNIPVQDFVA